jgi:hypothetical protein
MGDQGRPRRRRRRRTLSRCQVAAPGRGVSHAGPL